MAPLEIENGSHYLYVHREERSMVVCVCKGIRCTKIRALIADGATSVEAVGEACGAGTDCGSCRCAIEDLIEEHLEEREALSPLRRGRAGASLAG